MRRWFVVLGFVLAACGTESRSSALDELMDSTDMAQRTAEPQAAATVDITMREIDGADDDALRQIANVETFWTEVGDDIGLVYQPLDSSRLFPRSALEQNGPQSCTASDDSLELTADLTAFNAVVANCPVEGITVLWDDVELKPFLDRNFPKAGFALLIAHEWGHVVQNQREPVDRSTLLEEQQADCFAGAYMRWAEESGVEPFTEASARDLATLSALESRDPVGASPDSESAHGNGFDRIRAMQEGYDNGITFCDDFDVNEPPITQMAFSSAAEAARMGDLPLQQAIDLLEPALASYVQSLTDQPIDGLVRAPDPVVLAQQHAAIGEGAVLTLLGLGYTDALQQATNGDQTGLRAALERTCVLGSFLHRTLAGEVEVQTPTGTQPLRLAPGDIDETITTFATSPELLANPGFVFEFTSALRIGTIDGIDACGLEV